MLYRLSLALLRHRVTHPVWRAWRARRGDLIGSYSMIPDLVRQHAPGARFADVGCMWGVDGEYAFVAESAGATDVVGIDVFGPTPEFERRKAASGSAVGFVLGDVVAPETLERVGSRDVVLCAGVLYHHPAPFDLLVALRRMCSGTLILRSSTIPEVPGVRNMTVLWPHLDPGQRRLWDLRRLGVGAQVGITGAFEPEEGYGNWFWGLTASAMTSLTQLAGFEPTEVYREPFATTVVARAVAIPFDHPLPDPAEAGRLGERVSRSGQARPS